jgi:hypothetical protein
MNAKTDWIEALAAEVKRSSLAKAGRKIGRSAATVHRIINHTYNCDSSLIEQRVRGALMNQTVRCPVLGEINRLACQENQERPFAATNPQRVAVWKACRAGCPNSKHEKAS